ncbi:MAG: 50S ribosomal protein L18 [Proteobacteria bacterium]|nr:50S ribosomal protein L18 [Pseudomonadota bacterium]
MKKKTTFGRRKERLRIRLRRAHETGKGRARLVIFRSSQHIYAQVIDDTKGVTLVTASSLDKELKEKLKKGSGKEAAAAVGKLVAERAAKAGINEVAFDRGGYLYHGRVKALADGAREGGMQF